MKSNRRSRHRSHAFPPRSHAKSTGLTMRMWMKLLSMPPMIGVTIGFITSDPE